MVQQGDRGLSPALIRCNLLQGATLGPDTSTSIVLLTGVSPPRSAPCRPDLRVATACSAAALNQGAEEFSCVTSDDLNVESSDLLRVS